MHEHSVCQALLKQVEAIANEHGASRISEIKLAIGPLAGIVIDELRQAFPHNSEGTLAEGATLEIENEPLRVRCLQCTKESDATIDDLNCPACHSPQTQLLSGDQMRIIDVQLITEA